MSKESILKEIIIGYRKVIDQRYQYENLLQHYDIPESVTEHTVNKLKDFFLSYIYPRYDKRQEINRAFDSLNSYLKQPGKLLVILLDSLVLSFKYGRHMPKILKTGLRALNSYKSANRFENQLVEQAERSQIEAPFSTAKIKTLIGSLPRHEIERYIDNSLPLFETLHDRVLIRKIIEILQYLIRTMKKNPRRYGKEEINGLQFGLEILEEGDRIFNQLDKCDQGRLLPLIVKVERNALDEIFNK